MDKIDTLLQEIKEDLHNEDIVKEYFRLKNIIEHDKEILDLQKQVSFHQKRMCENKNNDEIYVQEKALYEKYDDLLKKHPIVINYSEAKEEITSLLKEIQGVLK